MVVVLLLFLGAKRIQQIALSVRQYVRPFVGYNGNLAERLLFLGALVGLVRSLKISGKTTAIFSSSN